MTEMALLDLAERLEAAADLWVPRTPSAQLRPSGIRG